MDNTTVKKCVLIQHGLAIRGAKTGTCCYNMQPPKSRSDYDIDAEHCKQCIDQEERGSFSYRQGVNEKYGFDHAPGACLILDVIPNINCNLACNICNEHSSSTWTKYKGLKFNIESNLEFEQFERLLNRYDLSNLQEINFSGGEPWLNNNIQRYLEKLQDRVDFSQITLRFSTNGSHAMPPRLAVFLQQFKLVLARFSLDDIGIWHEYQRYPGRWVDWQSNWNSFLHDLPDNIIPSINRTVSVLNIARLDQLDQWHQHHTKTARGDAIELIDHFAFGPYSLDHMTQKLKDHVLKNQGQNSRAWSYVKNKSVCENTVQLRQTIQQQDQQRGTNLQQVDPELYAIIFL